MSEFLVTEETQTAERRRKGSSPKQIQQNIIDLNLGDSSDSEFVKSELPDLSDFTEDGKLFEHSNKSVTSYDGFHESLLRMAYEGNEENMNQGNCELQESAPCKKIKTSTASVNGPSPVSVNLVSNGESSFDENSASSENRNCPAQASPAHNHIVSAAGDTGWYEVLHVMSTPESNRTRPCVQQVLQTIDVASIAQTTTGTIIAAPQPVFSTPVSCKQSTGTSVKRVPSNSYVYTPHPRSGQILYVTDPTVITPESLHKSNVQAVTPLMMNGTNMVPHFTPASQMRTKSNSSCDEKTSPVQGERVPASNSRTSSPLEENDQESAAFPLLDSPQAMDEERESHNMKERKRRARIKEACDLMRQLVPGMSEKTDKATVFEFAARYIYYLKNFVGSAHDKDFLIKYSPY